MNYKSINKDDNYFDDCPVCQAMKKMGVKQRVMYDEEGVIYVAPLHPKQIAALKEAFRKAGKQGGIIGEINQDI
jgi:hypothetical protein